MVHDIWVEALPGLVSGGSSDLASDPPAITLPPDCRGHAVEGVRTMPGQVVDQYLVP